MESESCKGQLLHVYVEINGSYYDRGLHCIDSPTAFEWARAIQKHYLKVICAIGLPGNLAAILTIMTKRSWRTAGILLALLAASDSAALVTKLVLNQLSFSLDPFPVHFCRSLVLTNLFSLYANWLLVVISAERTDALVYAPAHRGVRLFSKARVYGICVLMLLLLFGLHAPLIAGSIPASRGDCGVVSEVSYYGTSVWPWLVTVLCVPLPLVALLGLNSVTVQFLRKASQRRRSLAAGTSATLARERRREKTFTAMVLAASLLFVLLVLPQCFYFILFVYMDVYASMEFTPGAQLARQVTTLMADSTHALNFYVYFVSLRTFRLQFLACFRCRGWKLDRFHRQWLTSSSTPQSTGRRSAGSAGVSLVAVSSDQTATSVERRVSSSDQTATSVERRVSSCDQTATSVKRRVSSSDQTATGSEQRASSSDQTATGSEQRASSSDQTATSGEQKASDQTGTSVEWRASSSDQTATGSEQKAFSSDQTATGSEQKAFSSDQIATGSEQKAFSSDQTATSGDQKASVF